MPNGAGRCYVRLEFRRQMGIAVVGATAVVSLEGGVVCDGRIAITALAPTVRRVAVAEAALVGTDGGPVTAEDAGRLAAEAATPISDASVRRNVGRSILLGLEILIIADIVKTITIDSTIESAVILGIIVLVRTFLSFSIEIELEGVPPWRRP